MKLHLHLAVLVACFIGAAAVVSRAAGAVSAASVLTYHNDNVRSGLNPLERRLQPANVNVNSFGKLFSYPIDGYTYAEPLYVWQLHVPGTGMRNVVYVATEHDSVYAFDANGRGLIWKRSFIDPPHITTVPAADTGSTDIVPEIGITGTPVISLATNTLYVVSKTKNVDQGDYAVQLHGLDLASGVEKFGGPVTVRATVSGTGDGGSSVAFAPLLANQRPALLLSGGVVYVAFASHGDQGPYHGWVIGYDAATLAQVGVFNTTPNGAEGGIWQSGNGPAAASDGTIYVGVGNGTFDADQGGSDYGDSFVKLAPRTLAVLDYFTPSNQAQLAAEDQDMGTTGVVVLPKQASGPAAFEVLGGTKLGLLYLLDRDAMGHYCEPCNDSQALERVYAGQSMYGTPVFANGLLYVAPQAGMLESLRLSDLSAGTVSQSSTVFGFPGASPAISSNRAGNAIVWALEVGGYLTKGPAVLHAYDASDLSRELYNSAQAPGARDQAGPAVKFTVPTVANGRVYVGTQTELDVYGLFAQVVAAPPPAVSGGR